MPLDTKPNLTNRKFEQLNAETLNLSGITSIYGCLSIKPLGIIDSCNNYMMSGVTMFATPSNTLNSIYIGQNSGNGNNGNSIIAIGSSVLDVNLGNCNIGIGNCSLNKNLGGSNNIGIGDGSLSGNTTGSGNIGLGLKSNFCNLTGCDNIAIGINSLLCNSSGDLNVAIGCNTLCKNSTGIHNIGIGGDALRGNNNSKNISIGYSSLKTGILSCDSIAIGECSMNIVNACNSIAIGSLSASQIGTSNQNISIGSQSLYGTISSISSCNIAIGGCSMYCNNSGNNNIAMGMLSLRSNNNGNNNIALGCASLYSNTNGCNNIAFGLCSNYSNITGNGNLSMGVSSLLSNTIGNNNIALGELSLRSNTVGDNNIGLGLCSLYSNVSGNSNIAIGNLSLRSNVGGCDNIGFGNYTLYANTVGCNNIAMGFCSLCCNVSGNNNFAAGYATLRSNCCGNDNIALGYQSLNSNVSGSQNIGVGRLTLFSNTIGDYNVGIGSFSLYNNKCGNNNIGFGYGTLYNNNSGFNNVALGNSSLFYNTGSNNIGVGDNSLLNNTIGVYNVAVGGCALENNVNGISNVAIGSNAGATFCLGLCENQASCFNVFIGYNTQPLASNNVNQIVIGAMAIGCGDNSVVLGNDSIANTILKGNIKLHTWPTTGSPSDSVLVWNSADKCIKRITIGGITSGSTVTANNGLNKIGNNVRLGGVLTGDTSITGAYTLGFSNTYINITGSSGVNISGPTRLVTTPSTGAGTDSVLVWNSIDKTVKRINPSGVTSGLTSTYLKLDQSIPQTIVGALQQKSEAQHEVTTFTIKPALETVYYSNNCIANEVRFGAITSGNMFYGVGSGKYVTVGYNNTGIGYCALTTNTNGNNNSSFGACSLSRNVGGCFLVGIGSNAGSYLADGSSSNTGSKNSVYLGALTKAFAHSGINEIVIGYNTIGSGSNTVTLGNDDITTSVFKGNIKLPTTPAGGYLSDSVLLWNSTDKCVKSLPISSIISGSTCAITTANNGLNKVGSNVRLGGVLTGNTSITGAYTLGLSNTILNLTGSTSVNISGPIKLISTPVTGAGTDGILVWNSTDKCIKTISCSSIIGGSITTANNGLNKVGSNVRLGGALTGNTDITGAYTLNFCSGSKINSNLGYQISGVTILKTGKNTLNSLYVGCYAGPITDNSSDEYNSSFGIGIGSYVLNSITTGSDNLAIGSSSLRFTSSGCYNIGIGTLALWGNNTGCSNIAIGHYSQKNGGMMNDNVSIGNRTLYYGIGSCNVAIGSCSGYNSCGTGNIFIGFESGGNSNSSNKLYIANNANCNLIFGDFTGNTITLPKLCLCETPSSGCLNNSVLLWDTVDKCVKSIPISSITSGSTGGISTANNGLNVIGGNVRLGGALTGNTSITGAYTLGLSNTVINLTGSSCVAISGPIKLLSTPSSGNLSDSVLLWNSTDKCVKSIPISSITSGSTGGEANTASNLGTGSGIYSSKSGVDLRFKSLKAGSNISLSSTTDEITICSTGGGGISTANNGLNVVGTNVRLGGALTGNTSITGAYTLNFCSGSMINSDSGYYSKNTILLRTDNNQGIYLGSKSGNLSNPYQNIYIGANAGYSNTSGYDNVFIGVEAGYSNVSGCSNVFIGCSAGIYETGSNRLYISNGEEFDLITGNFLTKNLVLPKVCLCETPSSGSVSTDKILVWNSSDKCVKTLNSSFCTKQDKNLVFTNQSGFSWSASTAYSGYGYEANITTNGVTSSDIATVIFGHTEAVSGNYSPVSITSTNRVKIFAKVNTAITIPTIIVYVV